MTKQLQDMNAVREWIECQDRALDRIYNNMIVPPSASAAREAMREFSAAIVYDPLWWEKWAAVLKTDRVQRALYEGLEAAVEVATATLQREIAVLSKRASLHEEGEKQRTAWYRVQGRCQEMDRIGDLAALNFWRGQTHNLPRLTLAQPKLGKGERQ